MRRSCAGLAIAAVVAGLGYAALFVHLPAPVVIVLGLGLFVAPGYAWSEVFLRLGAGGLERAAVMIGLALMVPVFGGLALYAAKVPLHRTAWTELLAGVTLAGVLMALATRRRRDELPGPREQAGQRQWSELHAINLGAAVGIAIVAVGLAVFSANAQKYPGYTQLWLSPRQNNPVTASLGVTNHQGSTTQYRLVLLRRGRVSATWNLTLTDGQTWQRTISFTDTYSIAADLYRLSDLSHPFRNVDNGELQATFPAVVW